MAAFGQSALASARARSAWTLFSALFFATNSRAALAPWALTALTLASLCLAIFGAPGRSAAAAIGVIAPGTARARARAAAKGSRRIPPPGGRMDTKTP
ncbi:hypothetical protein DRB89_41405 [Streptomyces sp. ICC4]|nr:hypothetical protein DRB89_41405 [Streptomyces sp. ICC4]